MHQTVDAPPTHHHPQKFRIGAVVTLNSGGPPMTVVEIRREQVQVDGELQEVAVVGWFCSSGLVRCLFPADCLREVAVAGVIFSSPEDARRN